MTKLQIARTICHKLKKWFRYLTGNRCYSKFHDMYYSHEVQRHGLLKWCSECMATLQMEEAEQE